MGWAGLLEIETDNRQKGEADASPIYAFRFFKASAFWITTLFLTYSAGLWNLKLVLLFSNTETTSDECMIRYLVWFAQGPEGYVQDFNRTIRPCLIILLHRFSSRCTKILGLSSRSGAT